MSRGKSSAGWLLALLGAVATGVMLAVPYNYAGYYPLTWIAFVPLLLVAHGRGYGGQYLLGLASGLTMYLVATPWMVEFLQRLKDYSLAPALAGAALFWLLTAQLPALLMVSHRWLQRFTGHHALWAFPVLVMLFYGWFPVLFPLQLGESQSAFLPAIQGVSLTGVYGLDLMIGVSNALVAAAILQWRREPGLAGLGTVIAGVAGVLALAVWLGFGWWSLAQWDQRASQWPAGGRARAAE